MSDLKLSFEFFPPRNDAQQRRFWYALGALEALNPAYISMTWGALGSSSEASLNILEHLVKDVTVPITAHLSCSGQTASQMRTLIDRLEALGITRFLALRGDTSEQVIHSREPIGGGSPESILTHASDLVSILASDPRRDISVAAYPEIHPESESIDTDVYWLKHKLDAGAQRAITQFFFEADTFLRYRDKARAVGIEQTIVPGILPIHDIQKISAFGERCGASVPEHLFTRFQKATTDEARKAAAVEQCVELCQYLQREGVEEFHLYTLNQAPLSHAVCCELLGHSTEEIAAA